GDITTGPCSTVQVGGNNNQSTVNCGPPPPPKLDMKWTVTDQKGDAEPNYAYIKTITVKVNIPLSPVAISVVCDAPVEISGHGNRSGGSFANSQDFAEGNKAFVYWEGMPLIPH